MAGACVSFIREEQPELVLHKHNVKNRGLAPSKARRPADEKNNENRFDIQMTVFRDKFL